MPKNIYKRVLTKRLMQITEWKVNEEQGGFRKGIGFVEQIFAIKVMGGKELKLVDFEIHLIK